VARTHVVLERIASLLSLLKDAETASEATSSAAMRAFSSLLQAAIPRSRPPSTTSEADFPTIPLSRSDRPGGTPHRGEAIRAAANHRYAQEPDVQQATKAVQAGEGKRLMDELRGLLGEMEREERNLLDQRAGKCDRRGKGRPVVSALFPHVPLVCSLRDPGVQEFITRLLPASSPVDVSIHLQLPLHSSRFASLPAPISARHRPREWLT